MPLSNLRAELDMLLLEDLELALEVLQQRQLAAMVLDGRERLRNRVHRSRRSRRSSMWRMHGNPTVRDFFEQRFFFL